MQMQRKVTVRDIAAAAGVSVTAVSLYLNDKPGLSPETRSRIGTVANRLGYTRLRSKSRDTNESLIGLLIEKLPFSAFSDAFYGEIVQNMERSAREQGYNLGLVVMKTGSDPKRFVADHFHNSFTGVVVLGGGDIDRSVIENLIDEAIPVILVDVSIPHIPAHSVLADNFRGAYEATEFLLSRGYRRIACIRGPGKYPTLVERFHGYSSALIAAGLPFDTALAQEGLSQGVPEKGYREMKALLERGVLIDAVFCVSDRTAFGALRALQEAGLRVPDDIAVIGFDDVSQAAYTSPPLTTVHVPREAMGSLAIHCLHQLIKGEGFAVPYKSMLATSLVIRSSTR